ncbi:hypothetical protein PUNSTDRAFT_97886 [Punctularia strigosozonata HHB-11173 SS5]|uniref:uncharacterized protein n=1 Tax=Punctularia strigosozonata (strain HHB-11173) TaxID=741275 RepID=UPI0004416D06|nr:uncharacterized protein PUNSTDRAFT_97886 [Punctularia strigosozonata HHB-11173 SS5]EIN12920.1 hypothetical protein PUNSTDRAFT_97886 [Punctularia strigosozonata HHB-11173 SS5]
MSDAPVIFKRTKSKVAQRARTSNAENNEENPPDDDSSESPSTLATKLKKKARSKTKSRLSFGGPDEDVSEGDGDVFQVKKSNLSRKLTLGKASSPLPASLDQANISAQSTGPVYDAAYLSQLKASTPTTRPRLATEESTDVSMDVDDASGQRVSEMDFIDNAGAAIPSESTIVAAKQKRDRLRKGPEEDFISLTVSKYDSGPPGPHPGSRLMREEDEIGEGDDEFAEYTSAQERIALGKKSRKKEASKRKEEIRELIADAEEEDEETIEWEQEQLRRGGHLGVETTEGTVRQTYKPAPIPAVTPIPSLGPSIQRLTQSLTSLTTSHADSSTSMRKLADEREQLETRETELREMIREAEAKRSWFAAFREYIENVATFLDEKFPMLEKLEEEHVFLLAERRDMITKRRQTDIEDDLSIFLGSLPAEAELEEVVDELGRVIPQANPEASRRARRTARTSRHNRHRSLPRRSDRNEEEGFSTDSSLDPPDAVDFEEAMRRLSDDREEILGDVRAADFRDPAKGLAKWFSEWREKFGDIYQGAWGGLGLVGAWEFWVRLEILGWDPLEDPRGLDSFRWYTSLFEYSRPRNPDADEDDEDEPALSPEGDLVPSMISTAVIPRVCRVIGGGAFDPYSSRHTRKLVDLAEQLEVSVASDNQKLQILLKAAVSVFSDAVTAMTNVITPYMTLVNPRFDPEAIPARRRLLTKQSKLLQCMLQWRKYTGEKFGMGELVTTLVGECMLPIAETGWEVGGEERMRKVVAALPSELVPNAVKARLGGVGILP